MKHFTGTATLELLKLVKLVRIVLIGKYFPERVAGLGVNVFADINASSAWLSMSWGWV